LSKGIYRVDLSAGIVTGKNEKPLGSINSHGYLTTTFRHNGKRYTYFIHHIIAYCGGLDMSEELTVNHKDGNKLNNKFSNFETITNCENVQHASKLGLLKDRRKLKGEEVGTSKMSVAQVNQIRKEYIPRVNTTRMIANKYGVDHSSIVRIINHKQWQHVS